MAQPYTLDPITIPGLVIIRRDNAPAYLAETMAMAEAFAQQTPGEQMIFLPELSESTLDEQREQRIARVIAISCATASPTRQPHSRPE
jgi:hypothetical protein